MPARAWVRSTISPSSIGAWSANTAADGGQGVADRMLRQVGQLRARQQLDDHRRQVGAHRIRGQASLFGHVDLLSQLVAHALQALAHHGFGDPGVLRQAAEAPAAVVAAVAQPALGGVSVSSAAPAAAAGRSVQLDSASSRTGTSGTSSTCSKVVRRLRRRFRATVITMRRNQLTKPAAILEIAQPPERPQIRLLGGVLGQPGIAQHAQRHGTGHRLRLGHDQPECRHIALPGPPDQIVEACVRLVHRVRRWKDTGARRM